MSQRASEVEIIKAIDQLSESYRLDDLRMIKAHIDSKLGDKLIVPLDTLVAQAFNQTPELRDPHNAFGVFSGDVQRQILLLSAKASQAAIADHQEGSSLSRTWLHKYPIKMGLMDRNGPHGKGGTGTKNPWWEAKKRGYT